MTLNLATDTVITAAITAVVTIVVAKLAGWIASHTKRATKELQNMTNQKVPDSLAKQAGHFIVLFALIWMLLKTIAQTGPSPGGLEVALISAWTWAALTYTLHIWRGSKK